MNMKRFGKLLSLVGLLGLLFGLTGVSADASPKVRIAHHNLAFGNEVYLLYAVEVTGSNGAAPFMEFRVENEDLLSSCLTLRSYDYRPLEDGDEQSYYIFAFRQLSAAQMADVVYARAGVTVGGKTYYSDVDSYSICEYAARKLGLVDGVDGTPDEDLRELLYSMLEYGSKAQKYLNHKPETPANKFYLSFGINETPTEGVLYEAKDDGTAKVTGYEGTAERVVIARKDPDGRMVTEIGAGAFKNNDTVTEVIVPGTVEVIGEEAFLKCANLKRVELREGVKTIGEKAFSECSSMTELRLPVSVTTLGGMPFPTADDLIIHYAGTKAQLKTLLNGNPVWAVEMSYWFVCSDAPEAKYPQ